MGRSSVQESVKASLSGMLSLIFPSHCRVSGAPLREASWLVVPELLDQASLVGSDYCSRCGAPQGPYVGQVHGCAYCQDNKRGFSVRRVVAAGAYQGVLKQLIHSLKFGRERALARVPLGAWLTSYVIDRGIAPDIVTCVPLSRSRLYQRGFNQAAELAKAIAQSIDKPFLPGLLRRTKSTKRQATLPVDQRAANVKDAFRATSMAEKLESGRNILIVDDVLTTGTTLQEAALALKRAGLRRLDAAVVARAV